MLLGDRIQQTTAPAGNTPAGAFLNRELRYVAHVYLMSNSYPAVSCITRCSHGTHLL